MYSSFWVRNLVLLAVPCGVLLLLEGVPAAFPGPGVWPVPGPGWTAGVLFLGGLLGLVFRRSRMFVGMTLLGLAGGALGRIAAGPVGELSRDAVYHAVALMLPLAFGLLGLMREFSLLSVRGAAWIVLCAAVPQLVLFGAGHAEAWHGPLLRFELIPVQGTPVLHPSQLAMLFFLLSLLALGGRWSGTRSPLDRGLLWALLCSAFGLQRVPEAPHAVLYFWAAGVLLVAAVLQEGYSMAYLDELTQLPARRALVEETQRLGRQYAIAMLDVDHFKKFNDTYGHDVGDQVLRFIATRLRKVRGGGKPYRYGGEEFTILFPGRTAQEVLPTLEALRAVIEESSLTVRAPDRPRRKPEAPPPRKGPTKQVSVTISIGVAERMRRRQKPFDVIQEADRALYRAKKKGRNRVCL